MKQIWIVDDNADSRVLASAILSGNYEIVELASGEDALDLLAFAAPDLILLDISMPGVSGFDVLCEIRSRPEVARVPIVAYTARASLPERNGITALGFDRCVVKPLTDEAQLLEPIAELLGVISNAA